MISVLLATTGRPEMAETTVRGIIATTQGHDVEIVCAVDKDMETMHRMVSMDASIVLDYQPDYRGCSRAWNDALAASIGDPVVLAADDLVFQPGWLDHALATMAEHEDGWGFVGFNDGQGTGPDETDTRNLPYHGVSERMFAVRQAAGFPNDYEPVISA
jgi:GT2 family glycosyltransferase